MSDTPFWETEKDLTDAEQERIKVNPQDNGGFEAVFERESQ